MIHKKEFTIGGRPFSLEIGLLAPQADSAVLARYGDTVVLATVVASKKESDLSYFPLQVEYQEKLYAGGLIKGSRWVKREGRPTDDVILKGRLIDRSIRPLFPKSYHHDVQIVVTILSIDKENDPDMVGMIGVSCALALSPVPWDGPIAAVRMGMVDEKLVVNPTMEQEAKSSLDVVISASKEKVIMLEAGANQLSEDQMFTAITTAHETIKPIITAIEEFVKEHGQKKQTVEEKGAGELEKQLEKSYKKEIMKVMTATALKKDGASQELSSFLDDLEKKYVDTYTRSEIFDAADHIFEKLIRAQVIEKKVRVDGRGPSDIRPLSAQIGILPRTHGSALFQRGNTQALTITTLGAPGMEQLLESAEGQDSKRYIHHYNMPPFSVGETGRVGFPSRREIGHGALAERALLPVIPDKKRFPYTIRVVSEILSSNGSTSMASTCGSTLSLMDAGVPIQEPVAGISVGLVTSGDTFELLTDIMGVEDFTGDMDFKVAGTKNGITAIQLDVKIHGLTHEMIKQTLARAKEARMKILDVMLAALPKAKDAVSTYAPKIEQVQIPVDRIGEVIGPGGKMIRSIIAQTGCEVDVDDDGTVTIASQDAEKLRKGIELVTNIVREIKEDEEFVGIVKRFMPFGAFVEIVPGKEGLVHLSKMSTSFVNKPEDVLSLGEKVNVRVSEIDKMGRINLSMISKEDEQKNGSRSSGPSRSGGYSRDRGDRGDRGRDSQRGGSRRYQHPHLQENR